MEYSEGLGKWSKIAKWYNGCVGQIYPEPYCSGHVRGTRQVIEKFVCPRLDEISSVLDIGCGQGVAYRFFKKLGILWVGVTLGREDIRYCRKRNLRVFEWDMHFIDMPPGCVDLIWARHVVEHSPMPLFVLKHWHQLTRKYLMVVTPKPPFFELPHPNHYSVMSQNQWEGLFRLAGFEVVEDWQIPTQIEYRWLLRKV